jgi:hypothetical protein
MSIALTLGLAAAGGVGSWLRQRSQREVLPQLINESQYQQGLQQQRGAMMNAENLMRQQMAQAGNFMGQGAGFLQQYMQQDPAQFALDPMAAQRSFLAGAPELQQLARDTVSDVAPDEFLRQERENIMSQVGSAFGGSPRSGAFMGAASQALATPLLQRGQQQEALRSQLAGQLLGQSQAQSQQAALAQAQGQFTADQLANQRFLEASQGMLGLGGLAQQGVGTQAGLMQSALGNLAQMQQPVYATPDYVQDSPLGSFLGGAVQGAGMGALASNALGLEGGDGNMFSNLFANFRRADPGTFQANMFGQPQAPPAVFGQNLLYGQ